MIVQEVHWEAIQGPFEEDERWDWHEVLYAYVTQRTKEILYIGKAENHTVRQRLLADDKVNGFWTDLHKERRVGPPDVIVGQLVFGPNERFSRKRLADAEKLLILSHDTWGNIHGAKSASLPRMRVRCTGTGWPPTAPRMFDVSKLERID